MLELEELETEEDEELVLVYIAKKLKEAIALEDLFTQARIDYHVEPDTYRGGVIFASERVGAFFYVHQENVEKARELLSLNRYKPYVGE